MPARNRTYACNGFDATDLSRRHLLKVGGAGLLGLNLPGLLRAESRAGSLPVRAKSVIFLFQFGGPSHLDMFDRKPDAPDGIRSPLDAIRTTLPGVPICAELPRMAKVMDKVCLIRSMHHTMKNHNSASYYALSGHVPPVDDITLRDSPDLYPAYGSVVDRLAPAAKGVPTFVAYPYVIRDGVNTPAQHASFLGKAHDPLLITDDPNKPDFRLPELTLPADLTTARLASRRELQKLINQQSRLLDVSATARGLDAHYEKALAMLNSPKVRQAFDLGSEDEAVRDRYGRHTYGQGCLLARRLVEAGVRFVTVYFSGSIGGQSTTRGGWDTHGNNGKKMYPILKDYHLPYTDQTLPTLIEELDERGLLDETLVIWMGEFGRTPRINVKASRDHWPQCYTVLLAGGGVKRGFVYGASDKNGAYPDRDPVRPDDLAATLYTLLGIDPTTEVHDRLDRPLPIASGQPITDLIA